MTTAEPPFGGHFSPLDAYDEKRDCFRILDTWMKTPMMAVWVKTPVLFKAITSIDDESKTSRGICIFVDRCASATNSSELRLFEASPENADLYTIEAIVKLLNDGFAAKDCVVPNAVNVRTTEEQMRNFISSERHHVGILKTRGSQYAGGIVCEVLEDGAKAGWGYLLIHEDFKGNGFGSLLMDFAEFSGLKRGAKRLGICIFSFEENSPLHGQNYARKGYKACGTSPFPDELKSKLLAQYHQESFIDMELNFPDRLA
mmetsp:Transcript_13935/g.16182  ORF Transcript_13935/g.16182 Transcript_13935/m.16182 type:complete len:258 (-) Transcript_13935:202-975(-)